MGLALYLLKLYCRVLKYRFMTVVFNIQFVWFRILNLRRARLIARREENLKNLRLEIIDKGGAHALIKYEAEQERRTA